jgi:hypothetical protein
MQALPWVQVAAVAKMSAGAQGFCLVGGLAPFSSVDGGFTPKPREYFGKEQAAFALLPNTPAGGASEEEAKPDDETGDLREALYLRSARQPMSERQKPSGQVRWSIIA